MSDLESSRTLLLPGPKPPLSHFGATLLRHVVTTGLRYALHSLGAPMPDRAPIRFVELRLHLDRARLQEVLAPSSAAEPLLGALLEPGGTEATVQGAGAFGGAALFHRLRLRSGLSRRPKKTCAPPTSTGAHELYLHFRATVSASQPALSDALLGELLASRRRRTDRAAGRSLGRCLGRQAFALVRGGDADLASLGVCDAMTGPWSESPAALDHVGKRLEELPALDGIGSADRLRGEFRESFRRALEPMRTAYLQLATAARRHGVLDEVGDAFFIPFDLAEDLTGESRPGWLGQAVVANRAEYQRLLEVGSPPETIERGVPDRPRADPSSWALAPVWPLD